MTAARTVVAHALCAAGGADCTCASDPYEPACEWQAERADVVLRWPVARRMRLIGALAAGIDHTVHPPLHERLAAAGESVQVPVAAATHAEPAPPTEQPPRARKRQSAVIAPAAQQASPALPLDWSGSDARPSDPDAGLTEEEQMRRAAGQAWRA